MKKQKRKIPAEWEDICQRCGRCCYEKLEYQAKVVYTAIPCPHLDTDTKLCRIYSERLSLYPDCTQLTPELVGAGILPADCPYVARYADNGPEGQKKKG